MLDRQAKYPQTLYQFLDVMRPAGSQSARAPRSRMYAHVSRILNMHGHTFWESCDVYADHRRLTEEGRRESEQKFRGQQQEDGCYVTRTAYDGKDLLFVDWLLLKKQNNRNPKNREILNAFMCFISTTGNKNDAQLLLFFHPPDDEFIILSVCV